MVAFHHALQKLGVDLSEFEVLPDAKERLRWVQEAYWEQSRQLDEGLATLLQDLEQRGRIKDDTIVLITADHGEHLGEHGKFLHSHSIYEPLVHVPFLLQCPGVEPGQSDQPVSGVDLYPTVCAAMGVEPPFEMPGMALQGMMPRNRTIRFGAGNLRGFIRGSHKWVAYDNGQRLNWAEAYDLEADPGELVNLLKLSEPPLWVAQGLIDPPLVPSEQAVEMRPVANPELMQQLGYADQVQ
jgi:choline-sulfatase